MRKFIHPISKSPKYMQHQHHVLCKLNCEKYVTI